MHDQLSEPRRKQADSMIFFNFPYKESPKQPIYEMEI